MAIFTERTIKVNNTNASMDKDIYVYRGNRNIEILFKIVDHQFKFKDSSMIERLNPSHAYVTLLTPDMEQISMGKAAIVDGNVILMITTAMIDSQTECGDYTIVFDLYDEVGDSVLTLPPVKNQLHVLDRMTDIQDIPDELRFQFDEDSGNLDVVNIDVTYDGPGEIKTIKGIPLMDTGGRTAISFINQDISNIRTAIQGIQTDIGDINKDINNIGKDLLSIENNIDIIESDVLKNENAINAINISLNNIIDEIGGMSNDIGKLSDRIGSTNDLITSAVENINNELTVINGRLDTLEGYIVIINSLETTVSNLSDRLSDLENGKEGV